VGVKIQLEGKKLEFQRKKHHGGSILVHHSPSPLPSTDHQLVKLDSMLCQIIVMGFFPFKVNTCGVMLVHTAKIPIRIISLLQKLDRRTSEMIEVNPKTIARGEAALVLIRPEYLAWPEKRKKDLEQRRSRKRSQSETVVQDPLPNDGYCVDSMSHLPSLAKFVIYFDWKEIAVGVIKEVNPKS